MPFVVDNSVVSGWYLARQATPYADAVLDRLRSDTAIVPPLWELELVNVARTAAKRGILNEDQARLAVSFVLGLPITVDRAAVPPERILALALSHNLTAYDAAYLELALRTKLPLAASDGPLRIAAEKAGVSILDL